MFQIVIPVFNEQEIIDVILQNALAEGYLHKLIVANDASTDRTPQLLDYWADTHGLKVVHLAQNAKKEGAIRVALEQLESNGQLEPYTILLDADTRLQKNKIGQSVTAQLEAAIKHLENNNLGAMALRVNASFYNLPTPSYLSAFSTYFGLQFDSWLLGLQGKLWVINGAGGLFKSKDLLEILRSMVPSFETGDLQITVDLMKQGQRLCLYNDIKGKTFVPESFLELFKQRRRWERGTTKVIWSERRFYRGEITSPSLLSLALILHFAIYVGLLATAMSLALGLETAQSIGMMFLESSLIWLVLDSIKSAYVAAKTEPSKFLIFIVAAIVNVPVWMFVVIPARCVGFFEAIYQIYRSHRCSKIATEGAL